MAKAFLKSAVKRLPVQVATGVGVLGASVVKTQIGKIGALATLPKPVVDLLPGLLGVVLSGNKNKMVAALGDGMVAGAVAQVVGGFLPAGTATVAGAYNYPMLAAPYNFPALGYDSQYNTVAPSVGYDSQYNTVAPSVGYNGSMGRAEMPGVMGPSPELAETPAV